MPVLKVDHIVSFSSEDPAHPARNILASDNTRKWKCRTPGEKNAVVILQLEKASQITAIDIGNENSAYVEVLVSRSGSSDDYQVLLAASSFMTPIEARHSQNLNKVRMFTKDQLLKPQREEKWDRVKVVCTQPFNKHCQYGLAFINLINFDDVIENSKAVPVQQRIGMFALRPDSPDDFSAGSLFAKRKDSVKEEKLSGAAAIRDFSSKIEKLMHKKANDVVEHKVEVLNKTKNALWSAKKKDISSSFSKLNDSAKKDLKRKFDQVAPKDTEKKEVKVKIEQMTPKKGGKKVTKRKMQQETPSKLFESLLEGVTLVISGIQNPDRAHLRAKALSMGANYKADWGPTCTHLICAFPNTPKFNQVKGKGKIVKRTWLEDCHRLRKRLPWRRYALSDDDRGEESEEEVLERDAGGSDKGSDKVGSDVDSERIRMDDSIHMDEGSDTEERVVKLLEAQKHTNLVEFDSPTKGVYEADTDVEELF